MERYHAVFLDAGFTLLKMYPSWKEFFRQVARDYGLEFSSEEALLADSAARIFFEDHYYRPNDTWADDQSIWAFWVDYYRVALQALSCPEDVLGRCAESMAWRMNQPRVWQLYPETLEVLTQLKGAGYIIAVLSDWSSSLPQILEALGLSPYIDFMLVSAIAGVAKPQPAFFQRALDQAGVSAEEAVMVGDSLYADVQGALGVGIQGILLDRAGRLSQSEVPSIRHLEELWQHLGTMHP